MYKKSEDAPDRVKAIPSLTGVRGLAAFWVFLNHMGHLAAFLFFWPQLENYIFISNGFRGVDLFFILSGFILMHVHANELKNPDKGALSKFYITRFFRVYPINAFVLLLLVPFVLSFPDYVAVSRSYTDAHFSYRIHNYSLAGFFQSLLLAQTWTFLKLGEWNIAAWTLSAEVLGYAFFPYLARRIMKEYSTRKCVVYAFLSLSVLTCLLIIFGHAENNPTGTFGSVRMAFCFFSGICIYRAYQLTGDGFIPYASGLTILSIAFILTTMFWGPAPLLDSFGFAGLIFGLAYGRGPVNAFLTTPLALFMGKISFSFYLIHFLLIEIFFWAFAGALRGQHLGIRISALLALTAFCFLISCALYIGIEKPFQRAGKKLVLRWAQQKSWALGQIKPIG
jgi:peptidoglycan/LPS O-acetylase OafA/YrhL